MPDYYASDLAYIHDAGFGFLARAAAPVVLDALRQAGFTRGQVVDLACGSGILAAEVAAAGYAVLGIDLSEDMLTLARRRVPQADFRQGSILSAQLPPCVLVAAIGECFNYLFDPGHSLETLAALLGRIHAALVPGGMLILDVAEPGRVPGPGPTRGYSEGPDWAVLFAAEESGMILTRHITTFRQVGELYRRGQEIHRLRLLPRAQVLGMLQEIGFQVEIINKYGDFSFPPGWVGFRTLKLA